MGSEMCIRDRVCAGRVAVSGWMITTVRRESTKLGTFFDFFVDKLAEPLMRLPDRISCRQIKAFRSGSRAADCAANFWRCILGVLLPKWWHSQIPIWVSRNIRISRSLMPSGTWE